jgi:hypothetical protein
MKVERRDIKLQKFRYLFDCVCVIIIILELSLCRRPLTVSVLSTIKRLFSITIQLKRLKENQESISKNLNLITTLQSSKTINMERNLLKS